MRNGLAGLTAHSSGWGVGVYDFRNSGRKDVFVAQSHVFDNVEKMNSGLRYREPPAMFRNVSGDQDGKFVKEDLGELPAGSRARGRFRRSAKRWRRERRDDSPGRLAYRFREWQWPKSLVGAEAEWSPQQSGRRGCEVKVGDEWAYATSSGSYLCASDGRVHFGLGPEREATIEIVWPSGRKQRLAHVPADQILTVKEPE